MIPGRQYQAGVSHPPLGSYTALLIFIRACGGACEGHDQANSHDPVRATENCITNILTKLTTPSQQGKNRCNHQDHKLVCRNS